MLKLNPWKSSPTLRLNWKNALLIKTVCAPTILSALILMNCTALFAPRNEAIGFLIYFFIFCNGQSLCFVEWKEIFTSIFHWFGWNIQKFLYKLILVNFHWKYTSPIFFHIFKNRCGQVLIESYGFPSGIWNFVVSSCSSSLRVVTQIQKSNKNQRQRYSALKIWDSRHKLSCPEISNIIN